MILGYPGRTNRYMTSYEVNELLQDRTSRQDKNPWYKTGYLDEGYAG